MSRNSSNQYGRAAVLAVEILTKHPAQHPKDAWSKAMKEVTDSKESQIKSCPKSAFLGLCEEGFVKGIPKGKYTKSAKNKKYAVRIAEYIHIHPMDEYDKNELWSYAIKDEVSSQKQDQQIVGVVLAIKNSGLLNNLK